MSYGRDHLFGRGEEMVHGVGGVCEHLHTTRNSEGLVRVELNNYNGHWVKKCFNLVLIRGAPPG